MRQVFLRRVAITLLVTFAGLFAVALTFSIYFELPLTWTFLVAATLALGFAIEDIMRWRNVRLDRWQIDTGQLIHDGPDGRASVPLSEIASAKPHFSGRVVITLRSGQRMVMRYLPYPKDTAAQINAATGPG